MHFIFANADKNVTKDGSREGVRVNRKHKIEIPVFSL